MFENYIFPDSQEMYNLYEVLEELLSKGDYPMGLGEGSEVYADPSLDFLLRVLFTSVSTRSAHLSLWGSKAYEYMLEDIRIGRYQNLSIGEFEEKRQAWITDVKKTENPMLRIAKALRYGREVDDWETKKHFLNLVAEQKGLLMSMEVCGNMVGKGYSLSQIAEIVPWVTKADIYGLSHMLKKPLELTEEELREVETEYKKTGEPVILKEVFDEADKKKD